MEKIITNTFPFRFFKTTTFIMKETFLKCLILMLFFSLLDIRKRNRRSRGKCKNGNLKRKHKNKTFWTLADLCKILKSGRHEMLLKLSSLSIASLRKLDG